MLIAVGSVHQAEVTDIEMSSMNLQRGNAWCLFCPSGKDRCLIEVARELAAQDSICRARGVERRVAQAEPIVVRAVRRRVAKAGEKRAPARTFCVREIECMRVVGEISSCKFFFHSKICMPHGDEPLFG